MAYDRMKDSQGRHTVTAFFDDTAEAEKARADLVAAGFEDDDIVVKSGAEDAAAKGEAHSQSILTSLLDIFVFMPPHDQLSYGEGLRRGGVALAVHTSSDTYEQAIDILDRDGAVDLDERESEWKQGGWTAEPAAARPGGPGSSEQAGFEAANAHDKLVNPDANNDVRERIGTGTSDMTVGTEINPGNAIGDAASTPLSNLPRTSAGAASGSTSPGVRDESHGRRRVRSYRPSGAPATSAEAMPEGPDPQI